MPSQREQLNRRCKFIRAIRQFFYDRDVVEVDTPLLSVGTTTEPAIQSFSLADVSPTLYLQTSPEFFMKRLLAEGSGSIFQIAKAFRAEEAGRLHRREFSLLEWYRTGFDHYALMQEVDELLHVCLGTEPADSIRYRQLFLNEFGLDPWVANVEELNACLAQKEISLSQHVDRSDKDMCLDILMSHCLEPHLGIERPLFVYHYPVSQAAFAQIIDDEGIQVGARFELYYRGLELANGYYEVTDAKEQRQRFEWDNAKRTQLGLKPVGIDEAFLNALEKGLPKCSGVALGVDRLLMAAWGEQNIGKVILTEKEC